MRGRIAAWLALGLVGTSLITVGVLWLTGVVAHHRAVAARDPLVVAAGDIACDSGSLFFNGGSGTQKACRELDTSNLALGVRPTAVLALGDVQYEHGRDFSASYDPSWGRLKEITHPVVGNHEYGHTKATQAAAGYFRYFGRAAGDPRTGYYSFDLGRWHLIALNGNCAEVGGCQTGSLQERWLRQDLAAHPASCTLAYWHQPRFSSGLHGNDSDYVAFWDDLFAAHADVVLNGHDHDYERFVPQNPSGHLDATGIREFVVGTGGKDLRPFSHVQPTSAVRNSRTFGVLELTLHPASYDWKFLPAPGEVFTDSGSAPCR